MRRRAAVSWHVFGATPCLLSALNSIERCVQVGKLFGNSETEAKGTVQEKKGDAGPSPLPSPLPRPAARAPSFSTILLYCSFWLIVQFFCFPPTSFIAHQSSFIVLGST